ncbi:MAG: signal peptidase I [Oscillospiraceae bacterium]|nr:signal peptidase I [Oscillospiraceae bacterium]
MDKNKTTIPTTRQLETELRRVKHRNRYRRVMMNTVYSLITVAAVAVLVATLWMPVLKIYGSSMTPTLVNGNIVICVKTDEFESGDVMAFYYNNNILVKRVIAQPGQWVNITPDGTVSVDSQTLDEPYISEKSKGYCDIELPYQVPESRVFVMGDHRDTSIDSRSTTIGCVADENIVGKLVFCVWPLEDFGFIK